MLTTLERKIADLPDASILPNQANLATILHCELPPLKGVKYPFDSSRKFPTFPSFPIIQGTSAKKVLEKPHPPSH